MKKSRALVAIAAVGALSLTAAACGDDDDDDGGGDVPADTGGGDLGAATDAGAPVVTDALPADS